MCLTAHQVTERLASYVGMTHLSGMVFFSSSPRICVALPLVALLLSGCSTQTDQPPSFPAQPAWPSPQQAAAGNAPVDPVASRLTVWLSLVGSSHGSAQEYADFLNTRPVWPRWQLLKLRMQQALAEEHDPAVLARLCAEQPLTYGPALAQCQGQVGSSQPTLSQKLVAEARQAWMNGNDTPKGANALTTSFSQAITPEASWLRFDREEKAGLLSAARQTIPYLSSARQPLAQARLALHGGDVSAEGTLARLPPADAANPFLVIDYARWLRLQKRYDDAVALWKSKGLQAEATTHQAVFWRERDALAREFLLSGQNEQAFFLANDAVANGTNHLDAAFLSGWIALQKQNAPAAAEPFFRQLAASSSLITKSRGLYWLGRAHLVAHDEATARADFLQAASYPGTFYGQMAAAELAGNKATLLAPTEIPDEVVRRLKASHDPSVATAETVRLSGSDLAQAAQILVSWGDRPHARDFLTLLRQQLVTLPDKMALSSLALQLTLPDISVAVARDVGRDGIFLLQSGWPQPYTPPPSSLPPGLVLGLMRQESNFNSDAISSSNAIGLMQLKPSTAGDMVHAAGLSSSAATATGLHDPDNNMRLGIAYLTHLQDRFGSVVPYIAAAYNGGPTRLARWLSSAGDPGRTGASQVDMIDWIESIPFSETRNYVERVWENMTVYAALGQKT